MHTCMHTCRCALLCTLLSSVPHDATIGHTELAALQPLLTLMKGQRADPELQGTACRTIAMLGGRSVTLAKQLARVGAVKTLLLTMRAHLKVEEVSTHTYTYTHTHTHTHTHTMRAHLEVEEVSTHTYTYTHIHTHTYTHTYDAGSPRGGGAERGDSASPE